MHKTTPSTSETDQAILKQLRKNGRMTNAQIGEIVGLSASAVSRRISELESSGRIRGYSVVLDQTALGPTIDVFVRVTMERQTAQMMQAFETKVRLCDAIVFCYLMSGEYDYMLLLKASSMQEYEQIHSKVLSRLPGVQRLESSFAMRQVITDL